MLKLLATVLALCVATLGYWYWRSAPGGPPPAGVAASAERVVPLPVGSRAPGATVRDATGKSFDLGAAMTAGRSCLIFFRGGW